MSEVLVLPPGHTHCPFPRGRWSSVGCRPASLVLENITSLLSLVSVLPKANSEIQFGHPSAHSTCERAVSWSLGCVTPSASVTLFESLPDLRSALVFVSPCTPVPSSGCPPEAFGGEPRGLGGPGEPSVPGAVCTRGGLRRAALASHVQTRPSVVTPLPSHSGSRHLHRENELEQASKQHPEDPQARLALFRDESGFAGQIFGMCGFLRCLNDGVARGGLKAGRTGVWGTLRCADTRVPSSRVTVVGTLSCGLVDAFERNGAFQYSRVP